MGTASFGSRRFIAVIMICIWIRCLLSFNGLLVDSGRDFREEVWLGNIWIWKH